MDHIAIMHDGPLDALLDGRKTIESRWSVRRSAPYGRVHSGDTIYFKRSGGLVEAYAPVRDVVTFDNLNEVSAERVLRQHYQKLGASVASLRDYAQGKKYCTLIFLEKAHKTTPFAIDRAGFAAAAGWRCLERGIASVRK